MVSTYHFGYVYKTQLIIMTISENDFDVKQQNRQLKIWDVIVYKCDLQQQYERHTVPITRKAFGRKENGIINLIGKHIKLTLHWKPF